MNEQLSVGKLQSIATKIARKVAADEKGHEYEGNQNCQLCTWCAECQCRGMDILPRPVYSPRDIIFKYTSYSIVKGGRKVFFSTIDDIKDIILKAGSGARFYTHVQWKNSNSGHEFITVNVYGKLYILDGQAGVVADIDTKKGSYFKNASLKDSFLVRMDDRELNEKVLKYNDDKYIIYWDEEKDWEYLRKMREKKNKEKK